MRYKYNLFTSYKLLLGENIKVAYDIGKKVYRPNKLCKALDVGYPSLTRSQKKYRVFEESKIGKIGIAN